MVFEHPFLPGYILSFTIYDMSKRHNFILDNRQKLKNHHMQERNLLSLESFLHTFDLRILRNDFGLGFKDLKGSNGFKSSTLVLFTVFTCR